MQFLSQNVHLNQPIIQLGNFSFVVLFVFGYIRDKFRRLGFDKNLKHGKEFNREGYTLLYDQNDKFFERNIYCRMKYIYNKPIDCTPGPVIDVMDRVYDNKSNKLSLTGKTTRVINMGSYNYLGFAQSSGPSVDKIQDTIINFGTGVSTTRSEIGYTQLHKELESLWAQFLGVESSVVFGMGFATNSMNIPTLAGKGTLFISDEYNHSSIILGCRTSGAHIVVFKHNEEQLRFNIVHGNLKTKRNWNKIIIIVEGIYSMEATILNLPEIIRLKNKYKCYVYIDEAHSVGALGHRGRGVCDYFRCDPNDIDILMGTFTKSFGAAGGYLAGSKKLIEHIVTNSLSATYGTSISTCVLMKIIFSIREVMGGTRNYDQGVGIINHLSLNTRYLRNGLQQKGFIVEGHDDSPVVIVPTFSFSNLIAFIDMAYKRGIGLVGVTYPAIPLTKPRLRLCVSASHTKEMLDKVLEVMDEIRYELGFNLKR